jgi:hypothetical protein
MQKVMADTRALNSNGNKQIDIATQANRAIFEKDWAGLRDAQEKQRALMHEQTKAGAEYVRIYPELVEKLAACQEAVK